MFKTIAIKLLLVLCLFHPEAGFTEQRDEQRHQQALAAAKAGEYTKAIRLLQPLAARYPKPSRYFYDYLVVMSWAGQYAKVIQHANEVDYPYAPRYVLAALAFSFRQQKQFEQAQQLYQLLAQRFPGHWEISLNLALVYLDLKKIKQAENILQPLYRQWPTRRKVLDAMAYLYERKQQWLAALSVYEKILAQQPDDRVVIRKKILALNRLGASHLAYDMVTDDSLLSEQEMARIRADMAAHRVRWGMIPTDDPARRFEETDKAIAQIKSNLIHSRQQLGKDHLLTLTSEYDLLLALRNRYRMQEVLALNASLEKRQVKIPGYAKNAVCDAYLYEQQPQQAIHCYQQVIASGYGNLSTKLGLFYAYIENENYPQAQQWIAQVVRMQPAFIKGAGKKKLIKPDYRKLQVDTVQSLGIAFADDLAEAEARFEWMNQRAPFNLDIRKELANIDYWRGWLRKAQEEYEIGLSQSPTHTGLRLGQARNWLALKAYPRAEEAIELLYRQYPEDKGVAKQKRLWDIHNMREFRTAISRDLSSGGTRGSRGLGIDSYLFSAPLAYHYRVYLHHRYNTATFQEGEGLLTLAGVGGEYRAPNIRISGEMDKNHYARNRLGLNLAADYAWNDYVSAALSLQSFSDETPLRALRQGIYAKSVFLSGTYRWHEGRSIGGRLAYLDFSDNNRRRSISGFWREQWYSSYRYKFATRFDLYHSRNSSGDRIYFNPRSDFSAGVAVENSWLTWRRYENNFYQRLILSAGRYHQRYVKDGQIWGIQYEHRWQARHRLELVYGVKRSSARYDGNNEFNWNYYMMLDWKF